MQGQDKDLFTSWQFFYNFGPLSSHEILNTRGSIWNDTDELPPDPVVLTCEVCYEWPGLQPQQGHRVNSWRLQYLWKFTTDLLFTELAITVHKYQTLWDTLHYSRLKIDFS